MDISDVLKEENVLIDSNVKNKEDALVALVNLLKDNWYTDDTDKLYADILQRESEGATGIGSGVAIPHCVSSVLNRTTIAIMKTRNEIEWEGLNEDGVSLIILFAVSDTEDSANVHLKLLAQVARKLAHKEVISNLHASKSAEELIDCLLN